MYEITDVDSTTKALIEAALKSETREFRHRVTFGYWTLSDGLRVFNKSFEISNILSLKIKQIHSSDSGSLQMGCCCSSSAELEFYNPYYSQSSGGSKFTEKVIFVESGIKYQADDIDENGEVTNEYFYYFPMGYFNTGNPQSDDKWYTVKLTAYDDINTMTEKWNSNLYTDGAAEPNAKALIDETAMKFNLSVEYEFVAEYLLSHIKISRDAASILTSYSDADALGFLAGLAGANVRMNTQGKLWVGFYDKKFDLTVTTDIQWQNGLLKTQEGIYEIASVTSGADDNVYTSGTGKGVQFYNPIITQAQVTNIMDYLTFPEYLPCELEWRGNPCVEAGDLIYVEDENAEEFVVRVVEQELDLTGGLFSKIICPPGSDSINFDSIESSIRRELNIQKTALQEAIEKATAAINGSKGGYYEVLDTDSDGNPDGWIIKEDEGGTKGIIRANKAGIGLSKDGGKTYKTALTYDGVLAEAIICDDLQAIGATIGGWSIADDCIYNTDYYSGVTFLKTTKDFYDEMSNPCIFAIGADSINDSVLSNAKFALWKDGNATFGTSLSGGVRTRYNNIEFFHTNYGIASIGLSPRMGIGQKEKNFCINIPDKASGDDAALSIYGKEIFDDGSYNPIRIAKFSYGDGTIRTNPGVIEDSTSKKIGPKDQYSGLIHYRNCFDSSGNHKWLSMVKFGCGAGTSPTASMECHKYNGSTYNIVSRLDVYPNTTGEASVSLKVSPGDSAYTPLEFSKKKMYYRGELWLNGLDVAACIKELYNMVSALGG